MPDIRQGCRIEAYRDGFLNVDHVLQFVQKPAVDRREFVDGIDGVATVEGHAQREDPTVRRML